jgi:dihydrofolate reductase
MIVSLIAAMSEDRVIGRQGKLPWNAPRDLARFKSLTMAHAVVMGRKTFESIGRPLLGRKTIVLSKSVDQIEGCIVAHSLQEAVSAAQGDEELFVCGGEALFHEALPISQRIYLTIVHGKYQGEVHFPEIPDAFMELQREELPEEDPPLTFLVFERVEPCEPGADAEVLRDKGREALRRKLYFLARRCLEQSQTLMESPETASDLAYSMAKSGGDLQQALHMAEKALQSRPDCAHCQLNLGRIQLLAGEREKGLTTLRKGMQQGGDGEFLAELNKMGVRETPLFPSLPRSHPLNRYLGLLLSRLGLR